MSERSTTSLISRIADRRSTGILVIAAQLFLAGGLLASVLGTVWLLGHFQYSSSALGLVAIWLVAVAFVAVAVKHDLLIAALLFAIIIRVGVYLATDGSLSSAPDQQFYAQLALALSGGADHAYIVDGRSFYAHAPRLYALILGGVYFLLDRSPISPLILNSALDLGTAIFVMLTAKELGAGRKPSIFAAAAFLMWPHVIVASPFVYKESLAAILSAACFWMLAEQYRTGKLIPIRYGAVLGLLGMTQPAFFLLFTGLPLVLLSRVRTRQIFGFFVKATFIATLILLPWILRNWQVTGGFVPLTTGMGMNMYANAGGGFDFPDHLRHLSESEWSRRMIGEGISLIAADPLAFLAHQAKSLLLGFGLQHGNVQILEGGRNYFRPQDYAPVMQIPLIGIWASSLYYARHQRSHELVFFLLTLIAAYTFSISVWFEFGERHRAYLIPLLLAFCASAGTASRVKVISAIYSRIDAR